MGDPVSVALEGWERAVQEQQRLEREWKAAQPTATGYAVLRRHCDVLAVEADLLFDDLLAVLRSQGPALPRSA